MTNPYRGQPSRAFWNTAVAQRHIADFAELWEPMPLLRSDRVATAGSCFAQHIGNNLHLRGADFMDLEPAPPIFESDSEARRFGFGVFSCRYGNIYTSRQLLQLFQEAFNQRQPGEAVWTKDGRYFDALRPGIDPIGFDTEDEVIAERRTHLVAVQTMFRTLNVFVFTLGLTEGWASLDDETMFPTAPGTIAGNHDPARYNFRNLRYKDVMDDMTRFWALLKEVNPEARMLLTVSPVPLIATATGSHVLSATTYSKSVLRAVAGDLASDLADVHYFPSYEIVSSHPSRGMFFNPDLRTVNEFGVNLVMSHFFSGHLASEFGKPPSAVDSSDDDIDVICDEERLLDNL